MVIWDFGKLLLQGPTALLGGTAVVPLEQPTQREWVAKVSQSTIRTCCTVGHVAKISLTPWLPTPW